MILTTLLFLSLHLICNCFPLFLEIVGLQGKVPNACARSWFQFLMDLFRKEISRYPFFAICPEFSEHDGPYSNTKAFTTCWEYLSTSVPQFPRPFTSFHTRYPPGLHFVRTEILTCCKICTHNMSTEKCFFSNWLCSILTSYSKIFPSDKTAPWQKVTVIPNMKEIHSIRCTILLPLHRDSSYILLCYWIKACVTVCVEKICYDD